MRLEMRAVQAQHQSASEIGEVQRFGAINHRRNVDLSTSRNPNKSGLPARRARRVLIRLTSGRRCGPISQPPRGSQPRTLPAPCSFVFVSVFTHWLLGRAVLGVARRQGLGWVGSGVEKSTGWALWALWPPSGHP